MPVATWNLPSKRYDEIRETVADVLEDHALTTYPIDVEGFIKSLGIKLVPYSSLPADLIRRLEETASDGFTRRPTSFNPLKTTIFYNDKLSKARIRFTFAHELGHIFLEHPNSEEKRYEDEANFFANYFLGASPVVIRDSTIEPNVIMNDFQVSYSCALVIADRAINRIYCAAPKQSYELRILENCHLKKGAHMP